MDEQATRALVEAVTRAVLERLGAGGAAAPLPPTGAAPWGTVTSPRSRPLVAGNWKMNACRPDLESYLAALPRAPLARVDALLLPPGVLLDAVRRRLDAAGLAQVSTGGQDVHFESEGAHTGETSAGLLRQVGATWSLVGHSERRAAGEDDGVVARKVQAALTGGLKVMLCVGEHLAERRSRATFRVLRQQLLGALAPLGLTPPDPADLAVAYEPVWAIGTGEHAQPDQIAEAAVFLRNVVASLFDFARAQRVRILYGGSVTPESAEAILSLPDVDGVLVGGASLTGTSFAGILEAAAQAATSQPSVTTAGRRP